MKTLLFILVAFVALTSFISGLIMMSDPEGVILNMSVSLLEGTPFRDFLIPGIILATVVGGVNLLAVAYNLNRHRSRYNWALAGGLLITGWIVVQMLLIQMANWLHFLYLGIGVLIILTAYQLKGKWAV
ncbi:MAG: hypothetical protein IPH68_14640 [Chitinophagaceae bacterium]|nr:hypothetical protein [Chitinophagaceae bacterium]